MDDIFQNTRPPSNPPIPPPRTTTTSLMDASLDDLLITGSSSSINLPTTSSTTTPPLSEPLYSTVIPRSKRENPPTNTLEALARQQSQPQPPPRLSPRDTSPRMKTSSSEGVSTTNLRIRYLEQMVARLDGEKKSMDEEFGRQRKKFMHEMMQAESEANLAKESVARHVKEIENLNMTLIHLESKNSNGSTNQEIEALKNKLQEMSHEQHVKTEHLRNEWLHERKSLETQVAQLKADNKSLRTAAKKQDSNKKQKPTSRDRSKSPIRRSKSPSLSIPDGTDDHTSLLSTSTPAVNFSSESSLESSMLEAAKESQLLRMVVIPLEEEIDRLRVQLMETQRREERTLLPGTGLVSSGTDGGTSSSVSPVPMVVTTGEDVTEKDLFEKLLNQERVARQDLEMHADGLRRQKTLLLEDIEKVKEQLQESQSELKTVQESYVKLQKTFEQANIEFTQSKDTLKKQLQLKDAASNDSQSVEVGGVSLSGPASSGSRLHGNRGRSLSWCSSLHKDSVVVTEVHGDEDSGTSSTVSWKPMVEQLQKLMVGLRQDLDRKDVIVGGYQQQLERVQGQLMLDIEHKDNEIDKIKIDHDKIKAALIRERKQRDELRRQLVTEKEMMKSKIEQFQTQETKTKQKLKDIKHRFMEAKHTTQRDMAMFTDERGRLNELVNQRQEEYACLKGVHASEIAEYQQKTSKLKDLQTEAEMNVAATMEELSKVRVKEVQTEAKLNQQIADTMQLLSVAEIEKKTLADQLTGLQTDLIQVQKVNNKLERECNTLKASRSTLQDKSKTFIEDQQEKISVLTKEKLQFEETALDLQCQLTQLKKQLETSEANQKDFVALSQSLQVRLAEIEADNNENEQSMPRPPTEPEDDLFPPTEPEDDLFP